MTLSVTDRDKQLEGFGESKIQSRDVLRFDGQQSVLRALHTETYIAHHTWDRVETIDP